MKRRSTPKKHTHQGTTRKRRSTVDMIEAMEPLKNTFFNWSYAGDPETVCKLFPEYAEAWKAKSALGQCHFDKIPSEKFRDKSIVKTYGINLKTIRIENGHTQKQLAAAANIKFQALQQIEAGTRESIHRNILLIFCGIYQVSPETLLGIDQSGTFSPMIFYSEEFLTKARYIVDQLFHENPALLDAFVFCAKYPASSCESLKALLSLCPSLQLYKPTKLQRILKHTNFVSQLNDSANDTKRKIDSIDSLYKLSVDAPGLLDIFVSIAAQRNLWTTTLDILSSAGFLPFSSVEPRLP